VQTIFALSALCQEGNRRRGSACRNVPARSEAVRDAPADRGHGTAAVQRKGLRGNNARCDRLEAGISRRTFFSYFTSKEDVLLDTCRSAVGAIRPNLLEVASNRSHRSGAGLPCFGSFRALKPKNRSSRIACSGPLKRFVPASKRLRRDGRRALRSLCERWPRQVSATRFVWLPRGYRRSTRCFGEVARGERKNTRSLTT